MQKQVYFLLEEVKEKIEEAIKRLKRERLEELGEKEYERVEKVLRKLSQVEKYISMEKEEAGRKAMNEILA